VLRVVGIELLLHLSDRVDAQLHRVDRLRGGAGFCSIQ
jgi:hypothetical protein